MNLKNKNVFKRKKCVMAFSEWIVVDFVIGLNKCSQTMK